MNLSIFVLWALVGWCGTVPRPRPPRPPDPDPEPWWLVSRIIGVVTGIVGGWAYTQVFGPQLEPWVSALPAAASALGAFVLARFATDIYGRLSGGRRV
jgi:hypothetical protein